MGLKLTVAVMCALTASTFIQAQTDIHWKLNNNVASLPSASYKAVIGLLNPSTANGNLHVYASGAASSFCLEGNGGTKGRWYIISDEVNSQKVLKFNSGSTTTSMCILNNGNVGIGTTNPGTYKLAVEGKIGARQVVVTTSAWADHVLKDDYDLKPLGEVEKFIKENNHLENIPTEKEVLANGIDVGEMHAKLLLKVEELTLYVIQQQKEIEQLKCHLANSN